MVTEKQILIAKLKAWESEIDRKAEQQKKRIANDPKFQRPLVNDSETVYDHCDTNGLAGYQTGEVQ